LCNASPCLARRFCSQKRMMLWRSCRERAELGEEQGTGWGHPGRRHRGDRSRPHLGGEEAQLALHVLIDEVLFAREAAGAPAKLGLHGLAQTQLVGPSQEAAGDRGGGSAQHAGARGGTRARGQGQGLASHRWR
jgi:hypothetical protein